MAIEIVNMYLLKMVGNPELTVGSPDGIHHADRFDNPSAEIELEDHP